MIRLSFVIACVSASILAGCGSYSETAAYRVNASAYQPNPGFFTSEVEQSGYAEKQIDPTTWQVTSSGTTVTRPERVIDIALLRAAEIGKQNGFKSFAVIDQKDNLRCIAIGRGADFGGAQTVLTVKYGSETSGSFRSVDEHLVANMNRVKTDVPSEAQQIVDHAQLRTKCVASRPKPSFLGVPLTDAR